MSASSFRRVGLGVADISEADIERVVTVLRSGRLSAGPMMSEFEQRFAALHDRRHGAMLNSGTGALQMALQALREADGWADGDEVIVPAMTFVATVNIVFFNGLRPVLVDIDPVTMNIEPAAIEAAITPRTRAIIPVHLFGQPADMTAVMDIAARHGLRVIEDSCEAVAVHHRGRLVGSFGDFGCFSTYMAHLITTGVGGVTLSDDDTLNTRLRSLMNHGRNPAYLRIDDDENVSDARLIEIIFSRYDFVSRGQSFRVTEMEAALGIGQLDRLSEQMAGRARTAAALDERLANTGLRLPQIGEGNEHGFMMYAIRSANTTQRDRLMITLERNGVETRPLLPILGQACYADAFDHHAGDFPVAEDALSTGLYLPSHHRMDDGDVEHVGRMVEVALGTGR